ncbi:MAG: dethiobiotin synthase [Desulfuromonas sp.]|nr:MAG: dethiobiotin synthase [Desulfuromonas sp.]
MRNRAKGLIITGVDHQVGGTTVAAVLARICSDQGINTGVLIPAETGLADITGPGPGARLLKWAARSQQTDEEVSPNRFIAPLDPATAASKEKKRIDFNALINTAREALNKHDFTIIDGSGGLMQPLSGGLLLADLVVQLELPLVVVCGVDSGAINHCLLTLFTARQMELAIAGYFINKMPILKNIAEDNLAHSLAVMTMDELLGVLNTVKGTEQEKVIALAEQLTGLPTFTFLRPYLPPR